MIELAMQEAARTAARYGVGVTEQVAHDVRAIEFLGAGRGAGA